MEETRDRMFLPSTGNNLVFDILHYIYLPLRKKFLILFAPDLTFLCSDPQLSAAGF